MLIKPPPQLRLLRPSIHLAHFSAMKPVVPSQSCRALPALCRTFPFKLKHLWLSPRLNEEIGVRKFSTRPFRAKSGASSGSIRSDRGEFRGGGVRASKSLIEDEEELSDWVSDLRTDSARGRVTSDDEAADKDKARNRARSRDWERNKGQDPVKRRRESGREEFSESGRRKGDSFSGNSRFGSGRGEVGEASRRKGDSFTGNSRFGSGRGEVGESSRRKGDSFSGNSRFGSPKGEFGGSGRGRGDSFSKNSRVVNPFDSEVEDEVTDDESENAKSWRGKRNDRIDRSVDSRSSMKGRPSLRRETKFSEDKEDGVNSDEERKVLAGDIEALLSEESTDVDGDVDSGDDDSVFRKSAFSELGLEDKGDKVKPRSSLGTSDSYLSETR